MSLARSEVGDSSWLQKTGYMAVRRRQNILIVIGGIPFLWFLVKRRFDSNFLWATLTLWLSAVLPTVWAATRMRCSVCGVPVYALWLVGFPRGREKSPFQELRHCPYCLDDGTGTTGDATRVDRRKEVHAAVRFVAIAVSLFVCLLLVVFGLMVKGWFPNY
jgi:hypothetical protein